MEPIPPDTVRPAGLRPWSPTGIALLSLLLLPLGAILHGLNFRRLGHPGSARFALWRNLLSVQLLFLPGILHTNLPGSGFVTSLFYAAYFYRTQAWLYEDHRAAGGRKGSLLAPVLIGFALAALALAGLIAFR